ncbi:MAG TPA: non-ribosomal peptide synthetase, partial [Xanthomonadaceae bacterium]|nr:non-ribosomal peptide synthetase [Xanthomonadaceae bacterium]
QLVGRLRGQGWSLPVRAVFEQPQLAGMARQLERQAAARGIEPTPRVGLLPLAPVQRGLWFLDRMQGPGATPYLIPAAFRLRGRLVLPALRRAWCALVARHPILRTLFVDDDGIGRARILDAEDWQPDCSQVQPGRPAGLEQACEIVAAHARKGFDLTREPGIRVDIVELAVEDHLLLLNLHHLVADGWSLRLIYRELEALYRAAKAGEALEHAPGALQYADFAHWADARERAGDWERHVRYWRERLDGLPALLELPLDAPRPAVQAHAGDQVHFAVPAETIAGLRRLCADQGATFFMGVLAVYAVLLARFSGQDDLAIGTPVANRSIAGSESLVGLFANTIALRMSLEGAPTFRQLLEHARQVCLEAYEHQALPFASVVEAVGVPVSSSYNPLFQALLILPDSDEDRLDLDALEVTALDIPPGTAKFDLSLCLQPGGDAWQAVFEYDTGLFLRASIERIADAFGHLFEELVRSPDTGFDALPLLSPAQRGQVVSEFNRTDAEYPRDQSLHALFRAQVARVPDAIALSAPGVRLSYAELDARSDQLAAALMTLGVGAEACIGLCMERGPDMIVALLGILKAGAAYLPLMPGTPVERIALQLGDAGAPLLLAMHATRAGLQGCGVPLHCIEDLLERAPAVVQMPDASGAGDALAYVMYTSGSTGEPKGVMVGHRAVARLAMCPDYLDLASPQTFLALAPLAFDASTFEIWTALLNGHRLAIAPPHQLSTDELAAVLEQERVTTLWLTAGLFHLMVDHALPALGRLNNLLAGGDVLSPAHVRRLLDAHPGVRLINGYGPTENTTFSCCHVIEEAVAGSIPIGRPVANSRAYVLDRARRPVPVGVPGELYVGGDGVARGYLGRPAQTAERFLPDPFSPRAGARMYRTGDQARWLPDGTLQFLGRRDGQVKLRGFRVELGEIEAILATHPGVEQVVVTPYGEPAAIRLAAYVVPRPGRRVEQPELRAFLQTRVPDYMVPAVFVGLDSLPLTANGKIDRRALPDPRTGAHISGAGHVPPRSAIERVLAGIWERVLGYAPAGAADNFFERGGHSLSAVQAIALASEALGMAIPVRLLFQHPSIEDLARQLEGGEASACPVSVVPFRTTGQAPALFCFHALFASALFYAELARNLGGEQPVYGLQTPGLYGEEAPATCMAALVARHIDAIRAVQPKGPYRLAGYCVGGTIALETARRLQAEGESVERLVLIDSFRPAPGGALPPEDPEQRLALFVEDLVQRAGGDGASESASILALAPSERIDVAMVWARRAKVLPSDITGPDAFVAWMHASLANEIAYVTHEIAPYAGRLLFLRAQRHDVDPVAQWRGILTGNVEVVDVPGDHASMLAAPDVLSLCRVVGAYLA